MSSVLQEWVMELPLREQGTILTGIRGCDLTPKYPFNSTERQLVAFLRYCTMVPADEREIGYLGGFMQSYPPQDWSPSEIGHYPLHWVSHLMHAYQVVGYRSPNKYQLNAALTIYSAIVHSLHLNMESYDQMVARLSEDRIASGNVVQ